jgi:hypothetical protein
MADVKRVFVPNAVDELLNGWLVHAHKARDRHDEAARRYARGQYSLGIPSLVVSTVVGTSLFAALSSQMTPPLWIAILSMLAAVLSALQTFLDFGGRSDKHRNAAVKYKAAIRLLEETLVQMQQGRNVSKEQIDDTRAGLDRLEESAPIVIPSVYDRIENRYQDMRYVTEAIGLYTKHPPERRRRSDDHPSAPEPVVQEEAHPAT